MAGITLIVESKAVGIEDFAVSIDKIRLPFSFKKEEVHIHEIRPFHLIHYSLMGSPQGTLGLKITEKAGGREIYDNRKTPFKMSRPNDTVAFQIVGSDK